ncbi:MAG: HU family DNA-binding protein [Balneolaceae bacterium]
MDKTFVKAFRDVVREELIKKNIIEIEGLGRFENRHLKQREEKRENGQVLMMPPRDEILFTPEKREAS